jgi:hypothetical protein
MNAWIDGPSVDKPAQTGMLTPGYLLAPLRWAADPLVTMIQAEPGLLIDVFELDRTRMHLIALALTHLDGEPPSQLAPLLLRASTREVLRRVLGRSPPGIKRVLSRLPFAVLSGHGYRRLIEILDDPRSAKLLHHFNEVEITESMVRVLHAVPAALRPTIVGLVSFIDRLDHLPDGLAWLASRGAAASFEALVDDLAAHVQPGQFVARLKALGLGPN